MNDIIDLKDFMERVQDDKELLLELLEIFQEDFIAKRQALQIALDSKDTGKIKELAHSLKGASGNISAKAMHANFIKMEELVKANDLSPMQELFNDIDRQFNMIKESAVTIKAQFAG